MLWIKVFHITATIFWFTTLFFLSQCIYHTRQNIVNKKLLIIMKQKIYQKIALPSMLATLVFGLLLISKNISYYMNSGWMHIKLALVILLIVYHHICGVFLNQLVYKKTNTCSHTFYRIFNYIPVLCLVGIIILVVVKPF